VLRAAAAKVRADGAVVVRVAKVKVEGAVRAKAEVAGKVKVEGAVRAKAEVAGKVKAEVAAKAKGVEGAKVPDAWAALPRRGLAASVSALSAGIRNRMNSGGPARRGFVRSVGLH